MMQFGGVPITLSVMPNILLMIWLFIYGLVVYFLITAIRFMKNKNRTDEELVRKIDQLIELQQNKDYQG
jgi:uncharacterized membrane protein YciS (DUF1049 family)